MADLRDNITVKKHHRKEKYNYRTAKQFIDVKAYRKEVSRLSAIANKRVARLQGNDLQDSPALQKLMTDNGLPKFGVKGKNNSELQSEMSKLVTFLNSETSTIRGINANLKSMADTTGLKYKNLTDLRNKSREFFRLASRVEEYLRNVEDIASAIGYQKIWEVINEYVQSNNVELDSAKLDIEDLTDTISSMITDVDTRIVNDDSNDWVFLN